MKLEKHGGELIFCRWHGKISSNLAHRLNKDAFDPNFGVLVFESNSSGLHDTLFLLVLNHFRIKCLRHIFFYPEHSLR